MAKIKIPKVEKKILEQQEKKHESFIFLVAKLQDFLNNLMEKPFTDKTINMLGQYKAIEQDSPEYLEALYYLIKSEWVPQEAIEIFKDDKKLQLSYDNKMLVPGYLRVQFLRDIIILGILP